jgi:hypothetical protein
MLVVREKFATKSLKFLKDPGFCTMLDDASMMKTMSVNAGFSHVGAEEGTTVDGESVVGAEGLADGTWVVG